MYLNLTALLPSLTPLLSFFNVSSDNSASLLSFSHKVPTTIPLNGFRARNQATIQKIYDQNIYPDNLGFLVNQTVPAGLFHSEATGRITPLGNFTGFNDSTEYFFALSHVPVAPLYQAFIKTEVVDFQSACPEVASSIAWLTVGVYRPGAPDHGKVVSVVKQIAFWYFSPDGSVLRYDAYLPSLARHILSTTSPFPSPPTTIISGLCSAIQTSCTGSFNTQYPSTEACIDILIKKPFGSWDNVWSDSVVCRLVHVKLASVNPGMHCKHLGEGGGGKCVDVEYTPEGPLFDDQKLWGVEKEEAFRCKES